MGTSIAPSSAKTNTPFYRKEHVVLEASVGVEIFGVSKGWKTREKKRGREKTSAATKKNDGGRKASESEQRRAPFPTCERDEA